MTEESDKPGKSAARAERDQRLAAALRANLRRRKAASDEDSGEGRDQPEAPADETPGRG